MIPRFFAIVLLVVATQSVRAQTDGWAGALAASRAVSTQVDSLQRTFVTIPLSPSPRGLYSQADSIRIAMFQFRQTIRNGASKENVATAFFEVDRLVKQILFDLKGLDNPAVMSVTRRLAAAEADFQFAVIGPGVGADQQAKTLARQTIALEARADELQEMVKYAFLNDPVLPEWMAAMKDLRDKVAAFRIAQEKAGAALVEAKKVANDPVMGPPAAANLKAANAAIKTSLKALDQSWETIVDKLVKVGEYQFVLVQTDAIQFDATLGRADSIVGVENRKGRLPAKLLQE